MTITVNTNINLSAAGTTIGKEVANEFDQNNFKKLMSQSVVEDKTPISDSNSAFTPGPTLFVKKEPPADNPWPGGTHKDNEDFKAKGRRESNHIPPTSVYAGTPYAAAFPTDDSRPAHLIEYRDHRAPRGSDNIGMAPSTGSSAISKAYRAELHELLKQGKFSEAFIKDMSATRDAARENGRDPTQYNRGFVQAAWVAYNTFMPGTGERVLSAEQYGEVFTEIVTNGGTLDAETVEWAQREGLLPSQAGSASDSPSSSNKRDRDPDSEDGAGPSKQPKSSGGKGAGGAGSSAGTGATDSESTPDSKADVESEAKEIESHINTLSKHWDDLNGRDKTVSVGDLHKELNKDNPPELKQAIQYFLDNRDLLDKLDTAKDGGDADGKISNADLEAFKKLDPKEIARNNNSRDLSEKDITSLSFVANNWAELREGLNSRYIRMEDFERVAAESKDKDMREAAMHVVKNPELFALMDTLGKGGKADGAISMLDKIGLDDLSVLNGGKYTTSEEDQGKFEGDDPDPIPAPDIGVPRRTDFEGPGSDEL